MTGWWLTSYVVLWGLVVTLGILLIALAREVGALHLRLGPRGALEIDTEGPELWSTAPPLEGRAADGNMIQIGGVADRLRLMLFASVGCPMCEDVVTAVGSIRRGVDAVVLMDDEPDDRERATNRTVSAPEAFLAYAVPGVPYAVVLDEEGLVAAKGTVNDPTQLEGLVATAERRIAERRRVTAA
jgi:methylamine dehydrogenase accessory protein MauD